MANADIRQLIALARDAGFSESQAPTMAAIAMAESSGRPGVVNEIGCTGLWQINQPVHVKDYPSWTQAWLKDPRNNARAAKVIYDKQGLSAWSVYTSGAYKKYLPSESTVSEVYSDIGRFLKGISGGIGDIIGGTIGNAVSLPSQVTGFFDAAEKPVKAAMWLFNPASWVRIVAMVFGIMLMSAGILALSKAAE